jgi:hypothetical protein
MQTSPMAFDEGASIGYGHNSAWYEYDPSIGAFVRVYSWYDPASDTTPIQPDEIDVTDDPEFGLANGAASSASAQRSGEETISCEQAFPLPPWTVTATTYGGGGGLIGFLWRMIRGVGGSRVAFRPQYRDQVVSVSSRDCADVTDEQDACIIARGHLSGGPGFGNSVVVPAGMHFTFVFRDGRRSEWQGTGMSACVAPTRSCYTP